MKQKLPSWVVIVAISVVVVIGGAIAFRASAGPGDLPAPKIKVKQEVPDHLKGKVSPEVEAQIREQTRKYGEVDPNASGQPPTNTAPR